MYTQKYKVDNSKVRNVISQIVLGSTNFMATSVRYYVFFIFIFSNLLNTLLRKNVTLIYTIHTGRYSLNCGTIFIYLYISPLGFVVV